VDDLASLKQVLVQTQAVERLQETARRQGDREQQQLTRVLVDRAEIQGRQVEQTPRPDPVRNDPEGEPQSGLRNDASERSDRPEAADDPETADDPAAAPAPDDETKGAALDVRA
jgi:hypothetical protein